MWTLKINTYHSKELEYSTMASCITHLLYAFKERMFKQRVFKQKLLKKRALKEFMLKKRLKKEMALKARVSKRMFS
jgi:hypothetical protein